MEFTGERYVSNLKSAPISLEHWHRYLFASIFTEDKKVLDIACGEGYGSFLISKNAKFVIGVDIDENSINYAKSKYIKSNLDYLKGSVDNIPIDKESSFDVIVSFETIKHVTEDVKKTLLEAKCYIDFGNHPGRDRLPREAAMCGCVVIVGKRGSAAYDKDVPIPLKYKFDVKDTNIPKIIQLIEDIFVNYEERVKDFEYYRRFILNEPHEFEYQLSKIFDFTEYTYEDYLKKEDIE